MGKLDGKVALVTGSGRNIGRATVLKLAAEGANVVVNARSNQAEADAVAQEARGLGVKALSVLADVANKEQVDRMVSRALSEFGKVANLYGRILFFTGEGAFAGGAMRAHVSAAKMGLMGLARSLAAEFAPQNIRVNVVCPGSIDTSRANPEWYQGRAPNAAGIPLGRQGTPEEIAATCLFLVSDDGGFITGQTIHVNGGVAFY